MGQTMFFMHIYLIFFYSDLHIIIYDTIPLTSTRIQTTTTSNCVGHPLWRALRCGRVCYSV